VRGSLAMGTTSLPGDARGAAALAHPLRRSHPPSGG
jgi:hypothetical protein